MFTNSVKRQNATVATASVDLIVAVVKSMEGKYFGQVDENAIADLAARQYSNEIINRRDHDAK
ncbi:hypothetical protein SM033_00166 [Vibrio phage vB_VpaM_sm033]|nr:hypothetical protein SM033_00166 [Vibrio phage vB_VpaM_sm033]